MKANTTEKGFIKPRVLCIRQCVISIKDEIFELEVILKFCEGCVNDVFLDPLTK